MKDGPSIAPIAALAGDPARANILGALLGGKALTAGELANEAGITAQTASSHLAKLEEGGLITGVRQGRHRYFKLAGHDVAEMLETMMGVAQRAGHTRTRTGPKAPELRKARVCYDHLAGEIGVAMFDGLVKARLIAGGEMLRLTKRGEDFARDFGIDLDALSGERRPLCKSCLDWSQRRSHLAGGLGAAMLDRFYDLKWACRDRASRAVHFSPDGERALRRLLHI
ncbi:MAG TPA: winged helix-turn-helix domain-containing protein [Rhizomicrobium sp.]|jgi:DNA-binding transcriptional ArsR family regulator|nr:winged helix-turn-helix domain-containing protein [Rhizomicrobium sp.]